MLFYPDRPVHPAGFHRIERLSSRFFDPPLFLPPLKHSRRCFWGGFCQNSIAACLFPPAPYPAIRRLFAAACAYLHQCFPAVAAVLGLLCQSARLQAIEGSFLSMTMAFSAHAIWWL